MAEQVTPVDQYLGTNIVEKKENSLPYEILDFLFGVKSMEKIASGNGSWGDAFNIGITAATFFIPPAKLLVLPTKALSAVIKASSKVVANDVASVAAKNAAAKTLDDALKLKHQREGRELMGEPTPTYQVPQRTIRTESGREVEVPSEKVFGSLGKDTSVKTVSFTQKQIEEGADLNLPENVRVSPSTAIDDAFTPGYVPKPDDSTIPRQLSSDKTRYAADAPSVELTEKLIDEIDDLYKKVDRLSDAEFNSRRAQILLQLFPGRLFPDIPEIARSTTELLTSPASITNLKKKEVIRYLKKSEDPDKIRLAEELEDLDLKTLKQEVVKMGDGTRSVRENPYETTPARSAIQPEIDNIKYAKERLKQMLEEAKSPLEPADAGLIKRLNSEIDKLDEQAIKLQGYIDNPTTDAAIAQSTDIIPNVRPGRTSTEYLAPASYRAIKPKPRRIKAPDNPQRVSLSDLKADREAILMGPKSESRALALKQINKEIADLEAKQVPKETLILATETPKKTPVSKKKQWKRAPNTREVRKTQFDLEKAKKELEVLRQKYRELPALKPNDRAGNVRIIEKREQLRQKGKVLAAKIKAFDKPVTETTSDVVIKNNSEVTFHSGMATGADTAWAEAADAVGIKTIGHSFKGHRVSGNRPAMETRNELSKEQLEVADEFLERAAMRMGEKYNPVADTPEEIARISLLRRNYYQIKDADAVIAITELAPKSILKTVGGTRYAVQMGIDKGIPVYVFDQVKKSWFKWDGEAFVKSGLPPVYKSPATVGRREKDLLPSGKTAIKDYMKQFATDATKADDSAGLVVRWNNLTKAEQADAVYIGRAGKGEKGTFGNPYEVGKPPDNFTVEEAVELYRKDLWKKIKSDPDYAKDIYALKGKKLACPGPEADDACHGQVIVKAIKYLDDHPELMKGEVIDSFRGTNSFLSNMSSSPFKIGETDYPTVEHFYQAMKTDIPEERARVLAAKTAAEAKRIGKTVKLRKNWKQIQADIMMKALRAKFEQNPELRKRLIDTGEAELIEGNNWGDKFWGMVDGEGSNYLGKYLMQIRKELMEGK